MKNNKWKSYLYLPLMLYFFFGTIERTVYFTPFTAIDLAQSLLSIVVGILLIAWGVSSIE